MADLLERIRAEWENIEKVLGELCPAQKWESLSTLELAGVGAMLHAVYNGFENILKQVLIARGEELSSGPSWHRDLLEKAVSAQILSRELQLRLRRYAAFRHFFAHGYAVELDGERLRPLAAEARAVAEAFRREIMGAAGAAP